MQPRWILMMVVMLSASAARAADSYAQLSEPGDAFEQELAQVEDAAKTDWHAAVRLTWLYYQHGRFDRGLAYAKALLNKMPEDEFLQQLRTRLYIGKIREAGLFAKAGIAKRMRADCEADLDRNPNSVAALQCLAQFYLRAPGIAGGSEKKGLELAERVKPLDEARYHFLRYVRYEADSDTRPKAQEAIAQAVAAGQDPELVGIAVRFHLAAGETQQAWRYLDIWAEVEPEARELPYQIGRAAALSGDRLEAGKAALMRFLEGFTCLRGRDYRDEAHFYLGRIYERKGQLAVARQAYTRALALNGDLAMAQEALGRLG